MGISVRPVTPGQLEPLLPDLVDLFREAVHGGWSLGFLPPLSHEDARAYWRSLWPELRAESRVLLAAFLGDRLAGTGQLAFPPWFNGRHRAEVQKLFVATDLRGHGIGKALMTALHDVALQRGRTLIVLNARRGDPAERFYRGLGYREAGAFPGYTLGPEGERYEHVALYQELQP
jgi:GNAT superfamily N-acetyltransferase